MGVIFAAIGHDQSRATVGSFRNFYSRQTTRAEGLMKIPSNGMLYPELVRRLKLAVSQVFAQYSEFHAAMLLRPFHTASRRVLVDSTGPVANAFAELDFEFSRAKTDLSRAAEGRAVFQSPHLQLATGAMPPPAPHSTSPGIPLSAVSLPSIASHAIGASVVSVGSLGTSVSKAAGAAGTYPSGYFNCWGNMALRHGVWTKPGEGIIFGGRLVKKTDGGDVALDTCLARFARTLTRSSTVPGAATWPAASPKVTRHTSALPESLSRTSRSRKCRKDLTSPSGR